MFIEFRTKKEFNFKHFLISILQMSVIIGKLFLHILEHLSFVRI